MPLMPKYFHLDVSNVRWLNSNFDAFILFVFWCFILRWFCAMSLKQTNTMRVKVYTHTTLDTLPVQCIGHTSIHSTLIRKFPCRGCKIPTRKLKKNKCKNWIIETVESNAAATITKSKYNARIQVYSNRWNKIFKCRKWATGAYIHRTIHMYFVL